MIKFGACVGADQLTDETFFKDVNFDFYELNLAALYQMKQEEITCLKKKKEQYDLNIDAVNCFFPSDIKTTGPLFNEEECQKYVDDVLSIAYELGVKLCVIGSQVSRNLPEGYDKRKGMNDFVKAVRITGEAAKARGMEVAIEHLCRKDGSNFITKTTQAVEIAELVGLSNVGIVLDIYHFYNEGEELFVIENLAKKIKHIHFSEPIGRLYPKQAGAYIKKFCDCLKKINYNKRISIEAVAPRSISEYDKSLACMKELFKEM